ATWLGHASFLVSLPTRTRPTRILCDPIFSARAGPTQYTGLTRRLPPPCTLDDLPHFDFVVISHNHYDHLDLPTQQSIRADPRRHNVRYLVPLGLKQFFTDAPLNVPPAHVFELDWWDTISLPAVQPCADDADERAPAPDPRMITFVCTPAQHNSGRGIVDSRTTLWASWVFEATCPAPDDRRVAVYFAGDTGLMTPSGPCRIFDDIGDRHGPFDLALLPIWRGGSLSFVARLGLRHPSTAALTALHATPAHAIRMHAALRARRSLAMHFATFAGSDAEARDALVELVQAREAGAREIGDWTVEGGFGWVDVGGTAVVPLD
ncbi:beta-lactamase superfamily domain-containing protein, partial [Vararia minispora EC-137]